VEACPKGALKIAGEEKTAAEIMQDVEKDEPFYRRSGGGLTISGGEPACQFEFSRALLKSARRNGINTGMETSGFWNYDELSELASLSDYLMYDIKHMDTEKHQELTGKPNELILDNLRQLAETHPHILIRIPIIPGYNDDRKNLQDTADFIRSLPEGSIKAVEIMSFHQYGRAKYEMLDMEYDLSHMENAGEDEISSVVAFLDGKLPDIFVRKLN
jgi:pyruvate formate lyase activating enzyme